MNNLITIQTKCYRSYHILRQHNTKIMDENVMVQESFKNFKILLIIIQN